MRAPMRRSPATLALVLLCVVARDAAGQGAWVEVKSPRFTVLSDAGERRARDLAWQFEQFRSAIELGWPWSRVELERPVLIIAARDEGTMRLLLPGFWEQRGGTRPASLSVAAPDVQYIILRSDVRGQDTGTANPYSTSYWSYAAMTLNAAFGPRLPLWFRIGMAEVLSNTIVREQELRFGLPMEEHLRELQQPRLPLRDLLAVEATSPYFRDPATRQRYDAQSWALVHYMLYGRPDEQQSAINRLASLLLEGTPAEDAITQVFGGLEPLHAAYMRYTEQRVYQYAIMRLDEKLAPTTFTSRPVAPAEVAARRAALHVVMDRAADARALIEESRKAAPMSPASYEAEALLLDREKKPAEALAALTKAAELGSTSGYHHFRRATLLWNGDQNVTFEALAPAAAALRQAIAADPTHARAHALLSDIVVRGPEPKEAVELAARAVTLQPRETYTRMALGWALFRTGQREVARAQALTAQSLARTEQEQGAAKLLLDALAR